MLFKNPREVNLLLCKGRGYHVWIVIFVGNISYSDMEPRKMLKCIVYCHKVDQRVPPPPYISVIIFQSRRGCGMSHFTLVRSFVVRSIHSYIQRPVEVHSMNDEVLLFILLNHSFSSLKWTVHLKYFMNERPVSSFIGHL